MLDRRQLTPTKRPRSIIMSESAAVHPDCARNRTKLCAIRMQSDSVTKVCPEREAVSAVRMQTAARAASMKNPSGSDGADSCDSASDLSSRRSVATAGFAIWRLLIDGGIGLRCTSFDSWPAPYLRMPGLHCRRKYSSIKFSYSRPRSTFQLQQKASAHPQRKNVSQGSGPVASRAAAGVTRWQSRARNVSCRKGLSKTMIAIVVRRIAQPGQISSGPIPPKRGEP